MSLFGLSNYGYLSFQTKRWKNKSCHTSNWKSFVVLGSFCFCFFFDINNHQQNVTLGLRQKGERTECRIEQKKWKIGQNQTFPRKGQGFSSSLWNVFPWDYKSADCQNWVICWWYQWFYTLKKVHWWEENYWYFVHKRPDWNAWKAVIAFQE